VPVIFARRNQSPSRDQGGPVIPRLGSQRDPPLFKTKKACRNAGFFVPVIFARRNQSPCRDQGDPVIPRLGSQRDPPLFKTKKPAEMRAFLYLLFLHGEINPQT